MMLRVGRLVGFFNISLEIPLALTLKPAENRSIIIIIIVHNFNQHTDLNVLLLVTQIPRENLLPVTQETTE